MTPLSLYESYLNSQRIQSDPFQRQAILVLDDLYRDLIKDQKWSYRLMQALFPRVRKGVYMWGGVGRGKTFLMDLFYSSLPFEQKTRMHFHRFMKRVHSELKRFQGSQDPLAKIAKSFSKQYYVLCFDEFHVSDIADAMILAELFKALFYHGVVVVATSNIEPNDLYHNGLQRDKFLPTIDLIYHHMQVMHMAGVHDYRLQYLSESKCYHFPLNEASQAELDAAFHKLTLDQNGHHQTIIISDRELQTIRCADNVVWFTFEVLCESARSSEDYIEIAHYFDTVILSGVKKMGPLDEAAAKRFMHLVDEFYERHVTLIISAEVAIEDLYSGNLLIKPFERTSSRLIEMQSVEYLCKPHLP